jgi:hypothetical protein
LTKSAKNSLARQDAACYDWHASKGDNATIVIVPSTAIETMQLGGLAGVTALTATLGQERAAGAPGPWGVDSTPAKP